ncbi:hypothetical protein HMPREF1486_03782 [Streptomyces sp. HPH0547]|nr:hypothetical protein HMPREF1486_03782 [Streptomyces sp. HPH0547]GHJ25312.1 hypothetical protein TPA0909_69260 [Streptomyces albus]
MSVVDYSAEQRTGNHLLLTVNGEKREVPACDVRATLLDVLRERLGLTGAKKGCDRGSAAPAPCTWTGAASSPV